MRPHTHAATARADNWRSMYPYEDTHAHRALVTAWWMRLLLMLGAEVGG